MMFIEMTLFFDILYIGKLVSEEETCDITFWL